jgi:hypothetical protein
MHSVDQSRRQIIVAYCKKRRHLICAIYMYLFCAPEHGLQVIQRERLVACLLEHIEEVFPGKIRVRHNMEVEAVAVGDDGMVSLKRTRPSGSSGKVEHNISRTNFLVRSHPSQTDEVH